VIAVVLRTRENASLRSGTAPAQAFINGYHSGLWVAIGLIAAGIVLSYFALRPRQQLAGSGPADAGTAELELAEFVLGEPPAALSGVSHGTGAAPTDAPGVPRDAASAAGGTHAAGGTQELPAAG
jgi:hypothetical protein